LIPKAIELGGQTLLETVQCVISKTDITIKRDLNDLFFVS